MLPRGKCDVESSLATERSRAREERRGEGTLSSHSSIDKSADEVEVGDSPGDCTISCKKEGRRLGA